MHIIQVLDMANSKEKSGDNKEILRTKHFFQMKNKRKRSEKKHFLKIASVWKQYNTSGLKRIAQKKLINFLCAHHSLDQRDASCWHNIPIMKTS